MKTEQKQLAAIDLNDVTESEARTDLLRGANERLRVAAWEAKRACEWITNADHDALKEIAAAERWLGEARRHASAVKRYKELL
jgi:hypothetical protein